MHHIQQKCKTVATRSLLNTFTTWHLPLFLALSPKPYYSAKEKHSIECFSQNHPCRPNTCLAKTGLPLWFLGWGAEFLRAEMSRLLAHLFHQGVLDEQFLQLQQLQDETSPNFVYEVTSIYFSESEKLLKNLRLLLMEKEHSDYAKIEIHVNQFMGSSSSIGANRIRNVCIAFRAATEQNNRVGCLRSLKLLENEYYYLKNKLHEFFQMEQQRSLAARVRYPMQN